MWVMPSSSARCAQLPRAADKVPYYAALKKFRDYLNGSIPTLDESDIVFADTKLKKREHDALEDKKPVFTDEFIDGETRYNSDGKFFHVAFSVTVKILVRTFLSF